MKKILFLILCLIPINIKADYNITDYRVDMTIKENGDVDVIEAFKMDGIYNGYERVIIYKNVYEDYSKNKLVSIDDISLYDADNIILNEIRSIDYSKEEIEKLIDNSQIFKEEEKPNKGDYGVYKKQKLENGIMYKIYNPSMMNKDFYISYTIKNIIISHEDVNEFAIELFQNEKIDNFELVIHIPNNKEIIKSWVHTYDSKIIDNETIKVQINDLNDSLDFRVLFDRAIVKSDKKSKEEVLDKIIEIESKYNKKEIDTEYEMLKENAYNAVLKVENSYDKEDYYEALLTVDKLNEDNYKAKLLIKLIDLNSKVERKYIITKVINTSIMGLLFLGMIFIIYKTYPNKKYDKYKEKYYKEFPSNYKPYVVGYLLRKKITRRDLYSTILDMLNNNKLVIETHRKDYKLVKNSDDLSFQEERLMRFLFNRDDSTTFEKMKKRAKNHYNRFINKYLNWIDAAAYEANLNDLYCDVLYIKIFGIAYSLISIVACVLIIDKTTYISPFLFIIIFIIFLIYFILFYKRTVNGKEQYYKWKSFNRYLNSNEFKPYDIDKYLPYAITFGIDNKLIRKFHYQNDEYKMLIKTIEKSLDIAYKAKNKN